MGRAALGRNWGRGPCTPAARVGRVRLPLGNAGRSRRRWRRRCFSHICVGGLPGRLPRVGRGREEVAMRAGHFLKLFAKEGGWKPAALTSDAREALRGYEFPGNVRELKNIIERGLIESGGDPIGPEHLKLASPVGVTVCAPVSEAATAPSTGASELPLRLDASEGMLMRRAR